MNKLKLNGSRILGVLFSKSEHLITETGRHNSARNVTRAGGLFCTISLFFVTQMVGHLPSPWVICKKICDPKCRNLL